MEVPVDVESASPSPSDVSVSPPAPSSSISKITVTESFVLTPPNADEELSEDIDDRAEAENCSSVSLVTHADV